MNALLSRPLIAALLIFLAAPLSASAGAPAIGDAAPAFRLQDQNNDWHTLEDYQGQWVVLYFYPKADTPGCTTEACSFRDDIFKFRKMGAKIVGVSLDDVASQKEFAEKYSLPFTLLSDAQSQTAKDYGVLGNLVLAKYAKRETFIISPTGKVAAHYKKVNPDKHSTEVLEDLEMLMKEQAGEAHDAP